MQEATAQALNPSPLGESVLRRRYLLRNERGEVVETPDELWRRVAKCVASAERAYGGESAQARWEEEFYRLIAQSLFLPNSPTLFNAGREPRMLSACFVLPVPDSLDGILEAAKQAGLIQKWGGGVGFSFSRLRPQGACVRSTAGVASGPVSFVKAINAWSEVIKQGGMRRGANMGVLRVDHPDAEAFVRCKADEGGLEAFNLSVGITNAFMTALARNETYPIADPQTGIQAGKRASKETWDLICESAWKCGDPGLVFLDTINAANPTPQLGEIEATNPCGEQPLLPYESCNLGSINLTRLVAGTGVDWSGLRETAKAAVRFLDDVVDVNVYPLPQIENVTRGNRKIGLGVMGFADLLYFLGIPYDSEAAVELAENLMKEVSRGAREVSEELALEKGPFPNLGQSVYGAPGVRKVRNATRTTIAPTGTISLIAGTSSGIEPNFSLVYERKVEGERTLVVNPVFERVSCDRGFHRPGLMEEVFRRGGIRGIDGIPDDVKRTFVTALEIAPEWHVRVQAAFQKHTDNAVSKTVNLPASASVADVSNIFRMAFELGCKGITVYRDGSKAAQVLRTGKALSPKVQPRKRPEKTAGTTRKARVGCGNLYITVNRDERGICEVFTNVGRGGGCPCQAEAASRLASVALRSGVEPEAIVEQLRGIRCLSTVAAKRNAGEINVLSCPDAIGRAIDEFISGKTDAGDCPYPERCPECQGRLEHEGGRCVICRSCGFSRCF